MWAFLFLNFHYYKTKKRKSRFNQPQCPEEGWEGMGGSRGGESLSNKQYFLLSGVGHSARRGGHQGQPRGPSPAHSASRPGRPPAPPRSFPALANWRASPWMIGYLPSPRTGKRPPRRGHCPGQGRRVCVSREEKKVDQ